MSLFLIFFGFALLKLTWILLLMKLLMTSLLHHKSIQSFTIRVHPGRPWSEFINVAGCHNLKFLHLQSQKITDQEFHSLLLQLPLLEELYLFNCHSLRRINISASPRLKTLQVCPDFVYICLEMIEIAARSLKNFIFIAEAPKYYEIKVADCCCCLKTLVLLTVECNDHKQCL
ncbi:hypothetical protein SLE2022_386720 [Rubroshorea leprosula]